MASAKFLEEALSTDVDESAVSAIVGSLETQLVTPTPQVSNQPGSTVVLNQNHINSAISNGESVPSQKHEGVANGESMNVLQSDANKTISNTSSLENSLSSANVSLANNLQSQVATTFMNDGSSNINQTNLTNLSKNNEAVKLVYQQGNQSMSSQAAVITNRVQFPAQTVPNGNIGLSNIQSVLQTTASNVQTVQNKQPAIVIKTSGNPTGAPSLVSVPTNITHVNNIGSSAATASVPNIMTLSKPMPQTVVTTQNMAAAPQAIIPGNVQIVNVRAGVPGAQQQKGVQPRVVLSTPQMVGARPGQPVSKHFLLVFICLHAYFKDTYYTYNF